MSYRLSYYLLVLLVMGTILFTALYAETRTSWSLIALGINGLLLLVLLIFFFRRIVMPLHILDSGMNLLRSQDFSSRLATVGQNDADNLVAIFNEMIEQLRKERLQVREANSLLDLLINASPMGVIILDLDHNIKSVNPASLSLLGIDPETEILGKKLQEAERLFTLTLSDIPQGSSITAQPSGSAILRCSHLTFQNQGFKQPFFLIESLTDEVRKAEKEAYSKVIRMIAHEVNNTTAGLTSTLQSLHDILQEEPDKADLVEVLDSCNHRSRQMSRFITQFADVVRIPQPQFATSDINLLLKRCALFMEHQFSENRIALHLELSPEPLNTSFDDGLIEQVILNILKNSMESIGTDGNITLSSSLSPAPEIVITDDGPGISKELSDKIFNPFFSTKPNGQGIGLLFIMEVLDRHHFTYSLRTEEDGKTRFRIRIKTV
ncbi:sensor histidine kinase [Porphyromonas canoris]|uniref:histidine kinase n=1 Tax=Porphyromonas canoris TaxID=36875 RepID=A0ABR4XN34_9PORP|nr:ATP-binding protein [Porphyromonas canoris]KGN93613.1 hypothetical protein HQ43_00275 [Porphyromonas canoris]